MGFSTGIGQRWKQALGASLTIALLTAVAVVGITLFGSEVLAAWKTSDNSEQALVSGSVLNFDAPAGTIARFNSESEQASNKAQVVRNWKYTADPSLESLFANNPALDLAIVQANNPATNAFLNANPPLNFIVSSGALTAIGTYLFTVEQSTSNLLTGLEKVLAPTNPLAANLLRAFQTQFTQTINNTLNQLAATQNAINNQIPPAFRPAPVPHGSPTT